MTISQSRRLLLLGCSQKKRTGSENLPAIERYDGPLFRVLRKYIRENSNKVSLLDVYILSAKFGLIAAERLIPNYDLKMTPEHAQAFHTEVANSFCQVVARGIYDEVLINLGKTYHQAVEGYEHAVPSQTKVRLSDGSMGRRQAQLYDWLNQKVMRAAPLLCPDLMHGQTDNGNADTERRTATLKGTKISVSPDEVFQIARQALKIDHSNAQKYQSWHVLIDDVTVAPKWLVGQLTGLSVSSFHTGDARRVLEKLGITVRRV